MPDVSGSNYAVTETEVMRAIRERRSNESFQRLYRSMSHSDRVLYYQEPSLEPSKDKTEAILDVIFGCCAPNEMHDQIERHFLADLREGVSPELYEKYEYSSNKIVEIDRRLIRSFRDNGSSLPTSIWHRCKDGCFATLPADDDQFLAFDEVMTIHQIASSLRENIGEVSTLVQTRRRCMGGSTVAAVFPSRFEREPNGGTDCNTAAGKLSRFVEDVLPFLSGMSDSRKGIPKLPRILCFNAISSVLKVSNNLMYRRRRALRSSSQSNGNRESGADEVLSSILDCAGVHMRQYRMVGKRISYPEVNDLPGFQCGCDMPCFAEAPLERLHEWYNNFRKLSKQLHPRRKENQFLLSTMLCPLLNRTISICDEALSALFTVSPGKIGNVRRVLNTTCQDPNLNTEEVIQREATGYTYRSRHPIKRYDPKIRAGVEIYLEKVLRQDPVASDVVNVCRVYNPEINTQEKLRMVLAQKLKEDQVLTNPLSDSTLQRMIEDYLREKGCKISFTQSDHNACRNCKSMQYAALQYSRERKFLAANLEILKTKGPPFPTPALTEKFGVLVQEVETKRQQEDLKINEKQHHTSRDARIRGFLKKLTDYFRRVENIYVESDNALCTSNIPISWCQRKDHAMITHQDDMSKVDLPSFFITATSDITRWRYDINAHVNAVTGEAVVFSHEQGGGAKNAASIADLA